MLTKTKLAIAVAALGLGFATSSFARLSADENLGVQVLDQSSTQELDVVARRGRGADDKAGDDRGVHGPGHPLSQDSDVVARRGRGADDAPGHIRREDRRADRRQS